MRFIEALNAYLKGKSDTSNLDAKSRDELTLRQFYLYASAIYGPDFAIEQVRTEDIKRWFILLKNLQGAFQSFSAQAAVLRDFFSFWLGQDEQGLLISENASLKALVSVHKTFLIELTHWLRQIKIESGLAADASKAVDERIAYLQSLVLLTNTVSKSEEQTKDVGE